MLRSIYSINSKIHNKHIYIWNLNHSSASIFTYLSINGICVDGFICSDYEVQKKFFFNTQVYDIGMLSNLHNGDCLIIDERNETFQNGDADFSVISSGEILCRKIVNPMLINKNVYIYGSGEGGKKMMELLHGLGIDAVGFITTDNCDQNLFMDLPVYKYNRENFFENDAIIPGVINKHYLEEILFELRECVSDVYLEEIMPIDGCINNNELSLAVDKALEMGRKIFTCHKKGDLYGEIVKNLLNSYGIHIEKEIDFEFGNKDFISFIESIEPDETIVIIDDCRKKYFALLQKALLTIGLKFEEMNIVSITNYTNNEKYYLEDNHSICDAIMPYSYEFAEGNKGWKILGNNYMPNALKIIIIGGSTSTDEIYSPESWGRKLWKKLHKKDIDSLIYIGAVSGEGDFSELIRMIRDIHSIKPNVVVSMSGINDTEEWADNRCNFRDKYQKLREDGMDFFAGLKDDSSPYEHWFRIQKIMKSIVEQSGAEFVSFLQPFNLYMDSMTPFEKLKFEFEGHINGARDFYEKAVDDEFYINLLGLFFHKDYMYIDWAHYSDEANDIISEIVLKKILSFNTEK